MYTFKYKNKKDKNYFEGYYFRITNNDINIAVIFAITKNEEHPHSFIQIFKEGMDKCIYKEFNTEDFTFKDNTIYIKDNYLSTNKAYINIDTFNIDVSFKSTVSHSKSAMGFLEKAPLDCFQEVVFLDGIFEGTVCNQSHTGKIYIEKTYGNKFPIKWIWIQSNHSNHNSQLSFSVGYIPFIKKSFKGYLLLLKTPNKTYHFRSLDCSSLKIKDNTLILKKWNTKVRIEFEVGQTIELVGPTIKAKMDIPVYESLTGTASIKVFHKHKLVFEDSYTKVGLEHMMQIKER